MGLLGGDDDCKKCGGDGSISRYCNECGGSGTVNVNDPDGPGYKKEDCPNCTGFSAGPDGEIVEDCSRCYGTGDEP